MPDGATFSNPVPVEEGFAFCVSILGHKKTVVVATHAFLGNIIVGHSGLEALRQAAPEINRLASRLIVKGARGPVFLESAHIPMLLTCSGNFEPLEA